MDQNELPYSDPIPPLPSDNYSYNQPPKSKSSSGIIIAVVVALLLCCCCCAATLGMYFVFGDMITDALELTWQSVQLVI